MTQKQGNALVVGAGIAGIRSALDLAEAGHHVTLIDAATHMGGILSRLDYQFPTDGCGMCRMLPLVDRDQSAQFCLRRGLFHENIDIMLSTTLADLEGEAGNYTARLDRQITAVDPEKCNGCGACASVCPVDIPNKFNMNMGILKAAHLPLPHALPNIYTIDMDACTLCGACEPVCPVGAISLPEDPRKNFRILVVDDELIVRDSMKEWFEFEGYSVDMADSGAAALEKVEENSYDLMFLDIKMGQMDGTEVLKQVKESHPDLKVIMMTAYATVETAVETLTRGALEYIVKPFEPDNVVGMVDKLYKKNKPLGMSQNFMEFATVILTCGTDFYDPSTGKNTYGYGVYPDVVTAREFERLISGTGPTDGRLLRPSNGKVAERIAWIQCVGSRTLESDVPYCSSICCMHALKEAVLTREKSNHSIETVIYYMDMRCFGKTYEAYKTRALQDHQVILKRARPHSVRWDDALGKLRIFVADMFTEKTDELFDMVVLSVGVRPRQDMSRLCEMGNIKLNDHGFPAMEFPPVPGQGVFVGGSAAGPMDIHDTLIHASSASLRALSLLEKTISPVAEVALDDTLDNPVSFRDVSMELPSTALVLCQCGAEDNEAAVKEMKAHFETLPHVSHCIAAKNLCTREGWDDFVSKTGDLKVNRVVVGACLPHLFAKKIKDLSQKMSLHPHYFDVVDIFKKEVKEATSSLDMALSDIRHRTPDITVPREVKKTALVVGAGIAGMTAALALAQNNTHVVVVEKTSDIGGNLKWLKKNITGTDFPKLLEETTQAFGAHPGIEVITNAVVADTFGHVGHFVSTIEPEEGDAVMVEHGVSIIATGGKEAATRSMGYGQHPAIMTLKEFEKSLDNDGEPLAEVDCMVMIQCVDCRDEHKAYCSRVCCTSALKHALAVKKQNPDMHIFVLYRDMMAHGFAEPFFNEARKAGIIFIQYTLDKKPDVSTNDNGVRVEVFEPIINQIIAIEPQRLVLATGVVPSRVKAPAELMNMELDEYGFFDQADDKFRPVDSIKEGIFGCGMALGPRNVEESMASAEASAVRALRILNKEHLMAATVTAGVKTSLCSLCELCIGACPYGARSLNSERMVVEVDPVMCQGCGACASICPSSASFLNGFKDRQMLDIIDAAIGF
ncbi:heterodisulfide reductase subunit A [Desulfocicer vacuolatum DSM 3385]|uniref:Heterodisulfide reductase subunit A n=1 Tax=Desulfocicer vacuolatum DSM 3385 TaxID=1121400 RepID=A0A1W2AJF9_9BACT|nr:response regulator [Desulfocicer vacuolatum]SMC60754.1 heterodisulfide reductase subunit A [Desulfocicer vacuolatum DSM 3385]